MLQKARHSGRDDRRGDAAERRGTPVGMTEFESRTGKGEFTTEDTESTEVRDEEEKEKRNAEGQRG